MGRLFWKFFLFFILAQVTMVVGVSLPVLLRHGDELATVERAPGSGTARILDAVSLMLQRGDESSVQALLEKWARESGPVVYVVGANGREILNRAITGDPGAISEGDKLGARGTTRSVALADGRSYVVFVGHRGVGGAPSLLGPMGPGRQFGPIPPGFPVIPIVGSIVASLAVAALLAWYVSKPIRGLRHAFDAAARGDLDARIGDTMGRRRDELADLGRDFDRTAARLKLLMDGQRRLLHDVSHELRSPLARLQAAVGLARQQPNLAEASMERIERESVRMDHLIDELLALSRMEAGIAAGKREGIDLAEIVNDVVQDAAFEQDATSSRVTIETHIEGLARTRIAANVEMLHRAIENVVRNAARHTPSGGRIEVISAYDPLRREVWVTIADDGPGVPTTDLELIFEPFFRGAAALGTRGHGLGLAIARRVVEAHGGTIKAFNRPVGGLAVEIRLAAA